MEMEETKKKRPCSNNVRLLDLPHDNLVDILSRLPVKSICCFGCASKTLLNIVSCPSFVNRHMHVLTATNATAEVPQLMLLAESSTKNTEELMALQSLEYDGNILKVSKHTIASKILFRRHKYNIYVHFVFCNLLFFGEKIRGSTCLLVNPFKGEALMLPTSNVQAPKIQYPTSRFQYWYGMGFDNTTNTHKIVRVFGNEEYDFFVTHVYVLGTESWRQISSPTCNLTDKKVSAYGDMHWLIRRSCTTTSHCISVLSFNFRKERFYWTPDPTLRKMPRKELPFHRFHLINLRGSLSIVDASSDKYLEIWLLKNYDKKEWMIGYKIKVTVFEGHPYRSFRLWTCCEWEHGIFFKVYSSKTSTAYFLDLRSVSLNCVECPVFKRGLYTSIWSYTGGLISLENYGKLMAAEARDRKPGSFTNTWQFD